MWNNFSTYSTSDFSFKILLCVTTNKFSVRHQRRQKSLITARIKYNPPCVILQWLTARFQMKENILPWPMLWQGFRSALLYNPSLGNDRSERSPGDNVLSGDCNDKIPVLPMGGLGVFLDFTVLLYMIFVCVCLRGTDVLSSLCVWYLVIYFSTESQRHVG